MSRPIAKVFRGGKGWCWSVPALHLVSRTFPNKQNARNSLVQTLRHRGMNEKDYLLVVEGDSSQEPTLPEVYIWRGDDERWRWACPSRGEGRKLGLGRHNRASSALVDAECALGLDRDQMSIRDCAPPQKSSETVGASGPSPDTGDQQETAPAQSESDTDALPVMRILPHVTTYQWELLQEALRLLKTKVDKEIEAAEHVSTYDLKGPTRQAVKAALEADRTAQENLAIMILTFDPNGEFDRAVL